MKTKETRVEMLAYLNQKMSFENALNDLFAVMHTQNLEVKDVRPYVLKVLTYGRKLKLASEKLLQQLEKYIEETESRSACARKYNLERIPGIRTIHCKTKEKMEEISEEVFSHNQGERL